MRIIYQCGILLFFFYLVEGSKFAPVFVPGGKAGKANSIDGSKSGCPCWFDINDENGLGLTDTSCPCCPDGYLPCGYPNHKRCFKEGDFSAGERPGCRGINPYPEFTLSSIGAPCPWNTTDFSCAICTADGFLCAPFANAPITTATRKNGDPIEYEPYQYCRSYSASWNYRCWGTNQDCRNNPGICDDNASCTSTGIMIDSDGDWERYTCVCNDGYKGSGFSCADESTLTNADDVPDLVDIL